MRFFAFVSFFVLPALLSLTTLAKPNRQPFSAESIECRAPTKTNTDAAPAPGSLKLRQHVERRTILDVCAYIDTDALVGSIIPGLVIPVHQLASLKLCLCLSALPAALEAHAQLKLLSGLLGKDAVSASLVALINHVPSSKHCACPEHGTLQCQPSNPCGFTCTPPFVPEGDKCVCKAPYMSCNGQCGFFPHGCGSAVPYRKRLSV
ncbi:hypothetical protein QCA50_005462 [Cerrena zonata]|uniref:Uncharacterized protein n=1 Tax=Cerrena zonata TaxID=2478898 RepID=A0AAW0GJK1_9APHY